MRLLIVLVLTLSLTNALTNNQKVNQVFYGVFEQNHLPRPKFCIECVDDASAKKLVLFIDDIMPKIAKLLPPFLQLKKQIMDFVNTFDGAMIECLGEKYSIQAGSSLADIQHYFIRYFEFHYEKAHKSIKTGNQLWQKGEYYQFGTHMAQFVHDVVDLHGREPTDQYTSN